MITEMRRRSTTFGGAFLMGLILSIGACDCGAPGTISKLVPQIEVEPQAVEFNEIPLGATRRIGLVVKNIGEAELIVSSVDTTAPFTATLLDTEIGPQGQGRIDISFTPTNSEPATGVLVIASNAEDAPMLTVQLSGVGVQGHVEVLPTEVEFLGTTLGTSASAEVVVINSGVEAVSGQIRTEGFARPDHFALSGSRQFDVPDDYAVPAVGERVVDLVYAPLLTGDDAGRVIFETCGPRCGVELTVRASAVAASVILEPPSVDFGAVGLNEIERETVRLTNNGNEPIEITGIRVSGSASLRTTPPNLPAQVQPGGQILIPVEFQPTGAENALGELIVATNHPGVEEAKVRLMGTGEGPLFEVFPPAVSFGTVRDLLTHRRQVKLLNAGSTRVRVLDVTFTGDPTLAVSVVVGLPHTLGRWAEITVNVEYTPTTQAMASGTITITTDDPATPRVDVPVTAAYSELACQIEVATGRVNFGLLPLNAVRSRTAKIRNTGQNACSVLSGAFAAPVDPAFTIDAEPWPVMLAPQGEVDVSFSYAPTEMVESKGSYVVSTDDPFFPDHTVGLIGSAAGLIDLELRPNVVDFGQTRPGCPVNRSVQLINLGTDIVQLTAITITSSSTEFGVRGPTSLPVPVAAGATQQLDLRYSPTDIGLDFGDYAVEVGGAQFPFVVVARGNAVSNPVVTDVFTQELSRQVDVLFVIDDSCSMADEQMNLSRNFDAFIATARTWGVDFQIGVTTTDTSFSGPRGRLVGPVLTDGPTLVQDFQSQSLVGIAGSGFEEGLDAMARAFSLANRGTRGNAQLFRSAATKAVIIVSDEEDDSTRGVVNYVDILRTNSPSGFVTAVVSGQRTGCGAGALRGADASPRYEAFVAQTQGLSESICTPNWATTLSNLGQRTFGLRRQFPLSQGADPPTIEVRVNGTVVSSAGWEYDSSTMAVRFLEGSIPPEAANIEITYLPSC